MAETDTVVARLRDPWKHSEELCMEAATELARLQAENEALRRERDEARADLNRMVVSRYEWQEATTTRERNRAEAAEAKAARLKEALVAQRAFILHWTDDVNGGLKPTLGSLRSALDALRAALEAK